MAIRNCMDCVLFAGNKRIAFDLENYDVAGNPDGMTIDSEDNLFVALFNGGAVSVV